MKKMLIAAAAMLIAGAANAQDYAIKDAADIVKKADWKAMQTVEVVATETSYAPEKVVLKAGQPYKLVFKNNGEKDHYFTAPEFFKAVAWRKAQTKDGEIKAVYFTAFESYKKGGAIEMFLVPVTKGTYPVYCTIDDHREKGMDGSIVIE